MATDEPFGPDDSRIPADGADDGDGWMARFAELDDRSVDLLLGGSTPAGMNDLAPIAEFAAAVRARSADGRPEMSVALRAQIQAGPPVAPRHVGAVRRRLVLAGAAAAVVAVLAAASQNALPAPAQRLVSNVGDVVGIDVPRPEDDERDSSTPSGADDPVVGEQPDGTEAPGGTAGQGASPSDPAGENGNGTANGNRGSAGQPRGGATPADPGTPGDGEPATPATPPANSNAGGNGNAGGSGNGNAGGNGNATGGGTANAGGANSNGTGGGPKG